MKSTVVLIFVCVFVCMMLLQVSVEKEANRGRVAATRAKLSSDEVGKWRGVRSGRSWRVSWIRWGNGGVSGWTARFVRLASVFSVSL